MTSLSIIDATGNVRYAADCPSATSIPRAGERVVIGEFAGLVTGVGHAFDASGHQRVVVSVAPFLGDQDSWLLPEPEQERPGEGATRPGAGLSTPPTFPISKRPARRGRVRP